MADVFKVFNFVKPELQENIIDLVYEAIRRSAIPPRDFIKAFEDSRRLVLSHSIEPIDFFAKLREALESGVAPDECCEHLSQKASQINKAKTLNAE